MTSSSGPLRRSDETTLRSAELLPTRTLMAPRASGSWVCSAAVASLDIADLIAFATGNTGHHQIEAADVLAFNGQRVAPGQRGDT